MKFLKLFFLLLIPFIYGCSSTGGTLGGLFPMPKFMKGKVKNNIYHALDGSFEIKTPFKQGSKFYTYMKVKEKYSNIGTYVSFNTSIYPNEFYRVEIGKKLDKSKPSVPFKKLVKVLLQGYVKKLSVYGKIKVQRRIQTRLDGKKAVLVVLVQAMAARRSYQGVSPSYSAYHMIYIVKSPNGGGLVWVQWPNACHSCQSGSEAEILASDKRIKEYFKSFRLKI
ncbi:hypothetical protein MNBD_GAMMA12-86 [hydrothermal vent metagenome]|uniref:Lipoprotein n=1 Tax=hydrothermal vent metagenome TaxID=652676 RepID=A0A3B0YBR5_9ZZZZ